MVLLKSRRRSGFIKRIFIGGYLYKNQATGVIHPKFGCKSDRWITEETCVKKERIVVV
jgi:hypothetical protein